MSAETEAGASEAPARRKVWDLPTRLFHWLLVPCFVTGWLLGENRRFETIELHFYLGYAIGALVAFRLIWGFVGAPASRLSALFFSPKTIAAYLREVGEPKPSYWPGHAPLGSLAVLVLLGLLAAQVSSGLFTEDDALFASGPLASTVDAEIRAEIGAWHALGAKLLLGMVGLHLLAVAYYAIWKEEDLLGPMISGWKLVRRRPGAKPDADE